MKALKENEWNNLIGRGTINPDTVLSQITLNIKKRQKPYKIRILTHYDAIGVTGFEPAASRGAITSQSIDSMGLFDIKGFKVIIQAIKIGKGRREPAHMPL